MKITQLVAKHGDNWRLEADGKIRRSADANATTEWWDRQWALTRFNLSSHTKRFWDESAFYLRRERGSQIPANPDLRVLYPKEDYSGAAK